jgi:hypothetical protein
VSSGTVKYAKYVLAFSGALLLVIGCELIAVHLPAIDMDADAILPSLYYIVPILAGLTVGWWVVDTQKTRRKPSI